MAGVFIEPAFYLILKDLGLPTDRRADGSYWDALSQQTWLRYQQAKARAV